MTVKELRQFLQNQRDDLIVLRPSFDHSYAMIQRASVQSSEFTGDEFLEYFDMDNMTNQENAVKDVVVIE